MRRLGGRPYDEDVERRGPNYWIDAMFAVVLAGIGIAQLLVGTEPIGPHREPDGWAVALTLAMTLPLALRRRLPATVVTTTILAFMVDRLAEYPATLALFALGFAFHAAGSDLERRASLVTGIVGFIVVVGFTLLGVAVQEGVGWESAVSLAALTGLPFLLGRDIHESRRAESAASMRAERAEHEREARASEAVRAERGRIARELHDVVAHEMTVMTIQAAAARKTVHRDPDQAEDALATIETSGHEALQEMRRLLGLLRDEDNPAELAPQPGLGRLGGLVDQMEEAGLAVSVAIAGDPRPLPAGVDLNAYRIIQESLTNTLKHGGPTVRASVRLTFGEADLEIEVIDDGRGAARGLGGGNGEGHGIVGMRERVSMLEGDISTGPRAGGGYRVRAVIPIGT